MTHEKVSMLGLVSRLFRKIPNAREKTPSPVNHDLGSPFDIASSDKNPDWIEPSFRIDEKDLDLSDVSELACGLATLIARDVSEERLTLPTIPELGLAVRRKAQDPLSSATDLTRLIQIDVTISAKLIQVANSPTYMGYEPISSLNEAIARLGVNAVKDIVTGLTLKQLFVTKQPRLRRRLRQLWQHSVAVAANCTVLAKRQTNLDPEKALLAGLIHDVGELAVINYANLSGLEKISDQDLETAIRELKPRLGAVLVRSWGLEDDFVTATLHADNLELHTGSDVQLVDLIHVAQLHSMAGEQKLPLPTIESVPAVKKLGLAVDGPEKSIALLREAREEIRAVRLALAI